MLKAQPFLKKLWREGAPQGQRPVFGAPAGSDGWLGRVDLGAEVGRRGRRNSTWKRRVQTVPDGHRRRQPGANVVKRFSS